MTDSEGCAQRQTTEVHGDMDRPHYDRPRAMQRRVTDATPEESAATRKGEDGGPGTGIKHKLEPVQTFQLAKQLTFLFPK